MSVKNTQRTQRSKLAFMMRDLRQMATELSGDKPGSIPTTKTEFEIKEQEARTLLEQLRIDTERLSTIKKSKGIDYRDTDTIRLKQEITQSLKKLPPVISELQQMVMKESTNKKITDDLKKHHQEIVSNLDQALQLVNECVNQSIKKNAPEFTLVVYNPQKDRLDKSRERRMERQQKSRARSATPHKRNITNTDLKVMDDGSTSVQMQAFEKKVAQNMHEQDIQLEQIGQGLDDLLDLAQNMNKELVKQEYMLQQTDAKMDQQIQNFKTANMKLKDLLEKSGGSSRWVPIIILTMVLLSVSGVAAPLLSQI